jgi:hypothetical protein
VAPWESIATFGYIALITLSVTVTAGYFLLSRYRSATADRGARPELQEYFIENPPSTRWNFRIRNAGKGTVDHVTATVVEKNRRGYRVNESTVELDEEWDPGDSIVIPHEIEGENTTTIILRVDCAGPNDLRVEFRMSEMGELAVESVERTVFA